jgi:hypothetical protein
MQISVEELKKIEAPEPTKTWNPIPHGQIFERVNETLHNLGIATLENRIDVNKSGTSAFVLHRLDLGEDKSERFLELGWRNSIDKTLSLGFTSGTHIIVCSNLVFSGSWMEFRKHYADLQLEHVQEMASNGVDRMIKQSQQLAIWHDQMKSLPRSPRDADHLFMQMVRLGIVPGKRILDMVNAYDEEKERYGETLYAVYNSATQAFRSLRLPSIAERSEPLNRLIKSDMIAHPVYEDPQVIDV